MIQTSETTIEGVDYQFTPLMADPAREWLDRLLKAFGPAVSSFIEGLEKAGDLRIDPDRTDDLDLLRMFSGSLGRGLRDFTQALAPQLHKELADRFLAQVRFRTEEGNWAQLTRDRRQMVFATRLWAETRLLGWCLKEQYADFFEPLRLAIASAAVRMAAKSASPSGSQRGAIGSSGASSPVAE